MKKLILTLITGFAFVLSMSAQTQAVKVGPLGFLLGNYNVRYEKAFSEKSSWQAGANFFNYKAFGTGFGVDAGYRYYFREAIKGGYVYPSLGYDFYSTDLDGISSEKYSYSNLGIGAQVGYQWVSGGGFVVDLGLGYGYSIGVSADDALSDDDIRSGGFPRFTFALGYAF